ncbi:MAG: endolytic transglycosylase MltG [Pseudomonadota bacterium]
MSDTETSDEPAPLWRTLALRGGVFLVLLILVGAAGAFRIGQARYNADGPAAAEGVQTLFLLERGDSVRRIAARLEEEEIISSAPIFVAGARLSGAQRALKAGEYVIPSGASMADIVAIFVEGKSLQHPLTAPEGRTTKQILAIIAADEVLEGEITKAPAEGVLLPETYLFTRGETRDGLIARMEAAQQTLLDDAWLERADELPFSTREEAVILASIVEKETAIAEERGRIAAVFVNRLRKGMRLESDPTIIYGLTEGEPLGRGIRRSELNKKTDYNTYQIDGLPPTPICNPGADSLRAVLNPPQTDDLFFVADGSGGHVFAATYAEHRRNVAAWRKFEREQAAK